MSGYRGIGYGKDRKSKPWRIKVGKKTITRFARLSEACEYVADHAHMLYPKEHNMYPNVPTTDPEATRVRRKTSAPEEQPQEQPKASDSQPSGGMAPSASVTAAFLERTAARAAATAAFLGTEMMTLEDDPGVHQL